MITARFAGSQRKTVFPKAARPAAPCATYCFPASVRGSTVLCELVVDQLWLSGEEIISSARVYDVDLPNKSLRLLVTERTAKMLQDRGSTFRIGNPTIDGEP